MRYSKLVGKTRKEVPTGEESNNAQLLIRAGFMEKELAGVYAFLPLGWRVLKKVQQIIREEMEAIGGQELHLGSLQNPELWQKTGRWDDEVIDVWFKTNLKSGTELGLATTHEEPLTEIMTRQIQSYKDLPLYVFQFQNKFRNELRAKSGVLRTREFIMKDLYSFDFDKESHEKFYEKTKEAYAKIFKRLGLGELTFLTFASGGPFSKYSHEFQTICPVGEDTIYLSRENNIAINEEVYTDEVISDLGLNKADLEKYNGVEVGNIFPLGTKYSAPLGLTYADENGEQKPVYMGSYGIGLPRAMATVVETYYDDRGIMWPESIAPYKYHLVGLNLENSDVMNKANETYNKLTEKGIDTLFDDRIEISAGEKFSDADLIGCPYRLVVSEKTGDKIEIKKRNEIETKLVDISSIET